MNDESPDNRRALLTMLATNSFVLSTHYEDWAHQAVISDARFILSHASQNIRMQGVLLDDLLREYNYDPSEDYDTVRYKPRFLLLPTNRWSAMLAVMTLFGSALQVMYLSALQSTCEPLAAIALKNLQTNHPLAEYTWYWVHRIIQEEGPTERELGEAMRIIWIEVLCWYGPPDDPIADQWQTTGLLNTSSEGLRLRLLRYLATRIPRSRLHLPMIQRNSQWHSTITLPWDRWDARRWRLDPIQ